MRLTKTEKRQITGCNTHTHTHTKCLLVKGLVWQHLAFKPLKKDGRLIEIVNFLPTVYRILGLNVIAGFWGEERGRV